MSNFSEALQDQLKARNWSQRQLAIQMNVTPSQVSQILKPDADLKISTIEKVASALNCDYKIVFTPLCADYEI